MKYVVNYEHISCMVYVHFFSFFENRKWILFFFRDSVLREIRFAKSVIVIFGTYIKSFV